MLCRLLWLPLIPLAFSGCVSNGAASPAKSSVHYELDAKTDFRIGIREYAVTNYTYWEVDGTRRTKLWQREYNQAYAYHWVSPAGRVWIITSALAGPGGGGAGLYIYDKKGDFKGRWGYSAGMKGTLAIDGAKSSVVELRPGVEQLQLTRPGDQVHITQVNDSTGEELYSTVQELKTPSSSPVGTLEEVLADSGYQIPELGETLADWSYRIFSAIKVGETEPTKTWRQYFRQQLLGENRICMQLTKEEPTEPPTFATRGYSMKILNFHLEGDHPNIEVMRGDGSGVMTTIDLTSLGKMTADEAIQTWNPEKVRYYGRGGWQPLKKMEQGGAEVPDKLDVTDAKGRRHCVEISIEGKVSYTVLEGYAVREPKETAYTYAPIISQRLYESPNGKFKLRIRQREGKGYGTVWNATMLYATTDQGKDVNVEIWSNFWFGRFNGKAVVFDNGVAAYANEAGDSLQLVSPSGEGMGELGPYRKGAPASIDTKDLSIKETVARQKTTVDGIEMELPMAFDIIWKSPAKTLIYHATGGGGTYRLWWSDGKKTER